MVLTISPSKYQSCTNYESDIEYSMNLWLKLKKEQFCVYYMKFLALLINVSTFPQFNGINKYLPFKKIYLHKNIFDSCQLSIQK